MENERGFADRAEAGGLFDAVAALAAEPFRPIDGGAQDEDQQADKHTFLPPYTLTPDRKAEGNDGEEDEGEKSPRQPRSFQAIDGLRRSGHDIDDRQHDLDWHPFLRPDFADEGVCADLALLYHAH